MKGSPESPPFFLRNVREAMTRGGASSLEYMGYAHALGRDRVTMRGRNWGRKIRALLYEKEQVPLYYRWCVAFSGGSGEARA